MDRQLVFFSSSSNESSVKKPPPYSRTTLGTTKVPTPPSAPPMENPLQKLATTTPKSVVRKGVDLAVSAFKVVVTFLLKLPGNMYYYLTHPMERKERFASLKQMAKDEAHHYWVGTKVCSPAVCLPIIYLHGAIKTTYAC
jgi:hypothetical protein